MGYQTDFKAEVLVDALYISDHTASVRYGVPVRTLREWRMKLRIDEELAGLFEYKRKLREDSWAKEIPETIRQALNFIRRASVSVDPENPKAIQAMARALEVVGELGIAKEMMDVRFAEYRRETLSLSEPMDADWYEKDSEGSDDDV